MTPPLQSIEDGLARLAVGIVESESSFGPVPAAEPSASQWAAALQVTANGIMASRDKGGVFVFERQCIKQQTYGRSR